MVRLIAFLTVSLLAATSAMAQDIKPPNLSLPERAAFPELLDTWLTTSPSPSNASQTGRSEVFARLAVIGGLLILFTATVPKTRRRGQRPQADWAARAMSRKR